MWKFANLWIFLCGITLFFISSTLADPRIINGTQAVAGNTKYVVSIRLKRYESSFGSGHICGGSLIGPNKVLTAAHCLYNSEKKRYRKPNEFVVVLGALNRFERVNGTIVSDVKSIAYMNTFSMDTMRDDVGLMFLKTGLPANKTHLTVEPIKLANASTPTGVVCQVSGWGKTERGSLSPILLTANVTTISKTVCSISYNNGILNGMLCAGHLRGGTDSCQGDSGGPLVYNNTLVGVVSWGSGCAQPGFPGVYADVQYYYKWIMERNGAMSRSLSIFSIILAVVLGFVNYL
ncbi:trypsin eta [Musca vetustissima]|uniref:trypsin eta n=1 Tax=Musca vetustissima TaxID=27455 RepID=UPI002AB6EC88|nr:trypsin eta [Musca vetustissima]